MKLTLINLQNNDFRFVFVCPARAIKQLPHMFKIVRAFDRTGGPRGQRHTQAGWSVNGLVNIKPTHMHEHTFTHTYTHNWGTVDCLWFLLATFCLPYLGHFQLYLCQHFDNLRDIKYWCLVNIDTRCSQLHANALRIRPFDSAQNKW